MYLLANDFWYEFSQMQEDEHIKGRLSQNDYGSNGYEPPRVLFRKWRAEVQRLGIIAQN